MITGVGHYGTNGGTGATACTICRSRRGIPAGDSCMKGQVTVLISVAYVSGGGAKLRFQETREGESGIQLFYTSDIRLDEFPRGEGGTRKKQGGTNAPPPLNVPLLIIISIAPTCISLMSVCQRENHE